MTSSGATRPSTMSSWTTSCAFWRRSSKPGESVSRPYSRVRASSRTTRTWSARFPPADVTIERIGDLLEGDVPWLRGRRASYIQPGGDTMKPTKQLHDLGQSLWLDNITRELLNSGTLQRYIDELSVTGLTSNPTIFDHAIKDSTDLRRAHPPRSAGRANRARSCSSSWRLRI